MTYDEVELFKEKGEILRDEISKAASIMNSNILNAVSGKEKLPNTHFKTIRWYANAIIELCDKYEEQ